MQLENKLNPREAQLQGFLEGDTDSPIQRVNLLKFKDQAQYQDGRETTLSGAQAYAIYAREVQAHIAKVGGQRHL